MAVPLLEAPAQAPTYPQTHVTVNPSGARITTVLAPGVELSTTLDEQTMNGICAMWVQTRQNIANELKMIEAVRQSKKN